MAPFQTFFQYYVLNIWIFFKSFIDEIFHQQKKPLSVNYHYTRKCNYECGFCFHTSKTSYEEPLESAKKGLLLLKHSGTKKINFAGGEPFLNPKHLGELVKYCKEDLKIESISIVSNGSKIKKSWFEKYGKYLDILAISCDSFVEKTNVKIGRGSGNHIKKVFEVRDLCKEFAIKFKLNTVVNAYNWEEDMNESIQQLDPFRWKVFQVLRLDGENSGSNPTNRDITPFLISEEQFDTFVENHKKQKCLVPENNKKMENSYLILDEKMRFLNCTSHGKEPSLSILDVGVKEALKQSGFDSEMFLQRGGVYEWANDKMNQCSSSAPEW